MHTHYFQGSWKHSSQLSLLTVETSCQHSNDHAYSYFEHSWRKEEKWKACEQVSRKMSNYCANGVVVMLSASCCHSTDKYHCIFLFFSCSLLVAEALEKKEIKSTSIRKKYMFSHESEKETIEQEWKWAWQTVKHKVEWKRWLQIQRGATSIRPFLLD